MTQLLEARRTPDILISHEIPNVITGLAALVVDVNTSYIRAGREKIAKPSTERKIGELTVGIDTRKEGEDQEGNLHGALAELFRDHDIHGRDVRRILQRSLYHMEGNTYYPGFERQVKGRTIQCEYAIVLYDGPLLEIEPYDSKEVEDAQWMPIDRLLQSDVRPLAGQAVWHALNTGVIQNNLRRYHQERESRLRLLPPGFSINERYEKRELLPDMGKQLV
jgi:hypothetical protein